MTDHGKKPSDFNAHGPFTPVDLKPRPGAVNIRGETKYDGFQVLAPVFTQDLETRPAADGARFLGVPAPGQALPDDGCHTCRHHSARKRPRVTDTAGYDAYVEFADDDETVYTCRRGGDQARAGTVGFTGERLVPMRAAHAPGADGPDDGPDACAFYEAGSKRRMAVDAALERAQARWREGDAGEREEREERTGEFTVAKPK